MFITGGTKFELLSLTLMGLVFIIANTKAASVDIQRTPTTTIQTNTIDEYTPSPEYLISRADIHQVLSK